MKTALRALLFCLLAWAGAAGAQALPVDDSGSQVLGHVRMKWDSAAPRRGQPDTASGSITVLVRLDVSPWEGRSGRIYMRLPSHSGGPVTARWTARGPLLPGVLRDGERTLVYAGPITSPLLEDTFRLSLHTDAQGELQAGQLAFSFEIELETP